MKRNVTTERVVKEVREATVSDFSGIEMPKFHWSTVTKFTATAVDGCGNKAWSHSLDLMPEEMADFRAELDRLIASLARKYSARQKGGAH